MLNYDDFSVFTSFGCISKCNVELCDNLDNGDKDNSYVIIEQGMHICRYIICCYCVAIANIVIDMRFRFSIDNTTDHQIILVI